MLLMGGEGSFGFGWPTLLPVRLGRGGMGGNCCGLWGGGRGSCPRPLRGFLFTDPRLPLVLGALVLCCGTGGRGVDGIGGGARSFTSDMLSILLEGGGALSSPLRAACTAVNEEFESYTCSTYTCSTCTCNKYTCYTCK